MQGVYKGFGGTFADFKFNTPDYDKLMHIEKNVYSFAAAKNWQMLKELTMAIKEGDKTLSFNQFKQKASKILTDYDVNYLRTEYNAAIAGAQMASKWVDFQKAVALSRADGDAEPLLEYRTQEDTRVRAEHQALNKITRPVNDPFWNTYYPPNGWNCRCTVIRLPYSKTNKPSTQKEVNQATADCTPQKGFATNLAKSGFVFPKTSAYYIGLPENVEKAHLTIQRDNMTRWAQKNLKGNKYPSPIGDINITMKGIDKVLWQGHDYVYEKNNALFKLPELLKTAKHLTSMPDKQGKVKKIHYLEVDIVGEKSYIMIKESNNGDKNLYLIQDFNPDAEKKKG